MINLVNIVDTIKEFISTGFKMMYPANVIWQTAMVLVMRMLGVGPDDIGGGTVLQNILDQMYPIFYSIGGTLLMIFLFIGFLKEISDFRRNITMELLVTYGIKLFVAQFLLAKALPLMQLFFQMAKQLSIMNFSLTLEDITVTAGDLGLSDMAMYAFFGIVYTLVALVSSIMILFTVYKRYLNLYLMILYCPIALSTIPGDHGISQTAAAWVKSFLAAVFEIVVIGIALTVAGWMIQAGLIVFSDLENSLGHTVVAILEGMMTMSIAASSVAGAEAGLRKAFGL